MIEKDGLYYSTKTQAMYSTEGYGIDATKPTVGGEVLTVGTKPWAIWGSNDRLPIEMGVKLEGCGVLNAVVDGKARIAIGKGLQPFKLVGYESKTEKEILEPIFDNELYDWSEETDLFDYSFGSMYNSYGYGLGATQFIYNGGRDYINKVVATDIHDARLQKRDLSTGIIKNMYLCASFDKVHSLDANYVKTVPLVRERYELEDVIEGAKGGRGEMAMIHKVRRNGRQYYPYPLWYSADKWVDVAMQIPAFKKALHENQMHVKYMVSISPQYFRELYGSHWDTFGPEKRKELFDEKVTEIDTYLVGTDKAGKAIISMNYLDRVTGKETELIKITAIDDLMKDGKMLPDSSAANAEICFAAMMNPALIGAGNYGGSSIGNNAGGSNVRESHLSQMMLTEPERRRLAKVMHIVSKFNKWTDRYNDEKQRLVWRYPSGLLTTLDTGSSTKNENL